MKCILSLLLLISILGVKASAQQTHFLFVQSESRQPFNITLNKKVYSSTATGYLIIPKLADGEYQFTVGFGGNSIPDQPFNCLIEKKDIGFNLKNFGDKGWGLFNLQTFAVSMVGEAAPNSTVAATTEQPAIKKPAEEKVAKAPEKPFQPEMEPVIKREDLRPEPSPDKQVEEVKTTAVAPVTTPVEAAPTEKKVKQAPTLPEAKTIEKQVAQPNDAPRAYRSKISKISDLKGAEAYYITYVDVQENRTDTIQLLIPSTRVLTPGEATEAKLQEPRFLDIPTNVATETTRAVSVPAEVRNPEFSKIISEQSLPVAKCAIVANEDDFLKLRKKMAAADDNDGMVSEAKKMFKTRCFTTSQVKNLAYLFLTDEARYHFFDSAYPYVSDPAEFSTLAIMLSDSYFLNRFKAMLLN